MSSAAILIIDDEPGIRRTLASILEDEGYKVRTVDDALKGFEILEKEAMDLVFLDVLLPNMGGLEALEKIRSGWPRTEAAMISGHANVDMAVRAVKLGAFDFLEKPLSLDKVLTVCRNALTVRNLREENRSLKKNAAFTKEEIIGTSPEIDRVRKLVRQAAASDARILISGENGTGKELIARAIHRLSPRSAMPFVEVNCAAIPETLIESELFGHEKGAFTDAVAPRKGRFETASGGTLFLDEIGDMSLAAQAKVLRAIQEQKIERLGGEKTVDVDVRILAATNKDLERAYREGRFREDLWFRLNVIPIRLPSLKERRDDIPLLLFHFLEEFAGPGGGTAEFEPEVMEYICAYPWPGNIRELRNFAERIAVMYRGGRVGQKDAEDLLGRKNRASAGDKPSVPSFPIREILLKNFNEARESFEKYYLEFQLLQNHGIISHTAEAIGVYPSNLHAKIRKYGIALQRETPSGLPETRNEFN
jgi:two-component system nitrogen regulation response regulator NtrX